MRRFAAVTILLRCLEALLYGPAAGSLVLLWTLSMDFAAGKIVLLCLKAKMYCPTASKIALAYLGDGVMYRCVTENNVLLCPWAFSAWPYCWRRDGNLHMAPGCDYV